MTRVNNFNSSSYSDVSIIIPAYNEGSSIKEVIDSIPVGFNVVVVDDGSSDSTAEQVTLAGVQLVRHPINLGQGAAIQTGIDFALHNTSCRYFVTFDADGQHSINDVQGMVRRMRDRPDIGVMLGSRFLGEAVNISKIKKVVLKAAIKFSNLSSGLRMTDTHNGLRVFSREVAEGLEIKMADFAHASEIIEHIADKKWNYEEYPVTIAYTDYSRSKGQSVVNSVNIAFDILLSKVIKR